MGYRIFVSIYWNTAFLNETKFTGYRVAVDVTRMGFEITELD
jgi:hypothetical protein